MISGLSRATAAFGLALLLAGACSSEPTAPERFPVAPAPPSPHAALTATLRDEAAGLGFFEGDWLEDYGDAPFYGLAHHTRAAAGPSARPEDAARRDASLARARRVIAGSLLDGDLQEMVMSGLGLVEHVAATGDRADLPLLDDFVDRLDRLAGSFGYYLDLSPDTSWALRTYGPTAISALIGLLNAEYALSVGGPRASERLEWAKELERRTTERAFGDIDAGVKSVRAYRFSPSRGELFLYPNIAMLALEARLYRLTKDELYRVTARSVFSSIQPLKLSDAPARYRSPYSAAEMGAKTNDYATLSSQNYLALALLLLFEITGEARFVAEADRVIDGIAAMRGRWCVSHVHDAKACTPACLAPSVCAPSGGKGACGDDRCQEGILHHVIDGRLALPTDASFFCAGCNLQTLWVLGYRDRLSAAAP